MYTDDELSTVSATHLKPTQQPGVARHRPAVQAEIEDLLHRRRIEHRHHRRRELMIRLVRQRRRLGAVIVAGQHQHAAVLRRSGVIRVLEHVAAAVHAGPLPYHIAKTPSYFALRDTG